MESNKRTLPDHKDAPRSVYFSTVWMLIAAIFFCVFVEISKQVVAAETISPFRDDPFDAVVSFTFQIVLPGKYATFNQLHFIVRGNQLIFASIIVTLLTGTSLRSCLGPDLSPAWCRR